MSELKPLSAYGAERTNGLRVFSFSPSKQACGGFSPRPPKPDLQLIARGVGFACRKENRTVTCGG